MGKRNEEAAAPSWADGVDELSPSITVVPFDPSSGPFVLAFPSKASWCAAFGAAQAKIKAQCEAGARVGCSISASNRCKPPWWRGLFGSQPSDLSAREECEEKEMTACLALAQEACIKFSKDKCRVPFRDARILESSFLDKSDFVIWDQKKDGQLFGCKITENELYLKNNGGNLEGSYCRGSVINWLH